MQKLKILNVNLTLNDVVLNLKVFEVKSNSIGLN